MELLDSVDKEFNEYEKIYLCSGFAIGLLDQMITYDRYPNTDKITCTPNLFQKSVDMPAPLI